MNYFFSKKAPLRKPGLKNTITVEETLQNMNTSFVQIKRQYFLKK